MLFASCQQAPFIYECFDLRERNLCRLPTAASALWVYGRLAPRAKPQALCGCCCCCSCSRCTATGDGCLQVPPSAGPLGIRLLPLLLLLWLLLLTAANPATVGSAVATAKTCRPTSIPATAAAAILLLLQLLLLLILVLLLQVLILLPLLLSLLLLLILLPLSQLLLLLLRLLLRY
jgi:hypothetical protein